jgi:glycosyltransferase domain-containing protein
MKLPVNNDLTIILLLKGRDAFTIRWFEYAKALKLPYHVIVADGGCDNGLEHELKDKGFHLDVSYDFIRYPYDENHKLFYAKVLNALNKVFTPYVVLASNDDFYFFDSLNESVSFLKENPDYVTSRGEVWDFQVSPKLMRKGRLDKSETYGNIGGISKLYTYPTVNGECATDRIADFSLKANSIWHDVVRTENLKESYGALVKSDINDLVLSDTLICFMLASQGKIHRDVNLYMLHQCHPDMAALNEFHDSPFKWIDAPGWDSDFSSFLDTVAVQISKIDRIAFYEAKYKLFKIYTDAILLKKMKDHFLLLATRKNSMDAAIIFVKRIIRKNKILFNSLKVIYRMFSVKIANKEVPSNFFPKIDVISKFLSR